MSQTSPEVSTTERPTKRLQLGFLNNVPFSEFAPGGMAQGLKEAVELFRIAEELGYDSGWVRNRHFDNYLASPLTLLTAAAQKTEHIRLGTAIIPVGYEDPIRLAEDAAVADLLSDQRIQLGIATGFNAFPSIFGTPDDLETWKTKAYDRVIRAVEAIEGKVLVSSADGTFEYIVRPHSPTLRDRIWYGPGGVASAGRASRDGLDLLLSAIGPNIGLPFDEAQLKQIEAVRENWTRTDRDPKVSTSRLFFPFRTDSQRKLYQGYADLRGSQGAAASRPKGSIPHNSGPRPAAAGLTGPDGKPKFDAPGLMSPVVVGEPAEIVEYLRSDAAVSESDELNIFLPPGFSHTEYIELLENIVEDVAPQLGWSPADR
jgi:alkanesulfonate monooxygenase SsuD/methylene tetrahydromethanopterin reductase-like flavin-dependent oxidoreductase (luciferase family)